MQTPFFLFLGDLGGGEIMLIMVVILIFFGANKIPELARGLGKGIREFKDASSEIRSELENAGQPKQPPYNQAPGYQPPYNQPPYQQAPYPQDPSYQQPAPQAAYPVTPTPNPLVSDAQIVAETPLAPPMDGGITPPAPAHPRLDQTTND